MPDIVTFDPINLIITEISSGGDNEISWQEMYGEWKDWLLADLSRLGYPQAFRYAGADPISLTRSLGTTYFIMNGWRFRPAELNHRLTINGNCFSDPAGFSVIVPTLGTYTVAVEYSTSNLIDTVITGGGTGPTPAQIADAVWDEQVNTHNVAGSAGKKVSEIDKTTKTNLAFNL